MTRETHNDTHDILKNGIIVISLFGMCWMGWELYCVKQQPPDVRGDPARIPTFRGKTIEGAYVQMADGRSRVLIEFDDWAAGKRFATTQGRFFVKVEKE